MPGGVSRHDPLALEVNPVATGRQTLHLIQIGFIAGIAMEFMPGINQRQRIAIHHCGAGEAAVFILRAFRGQRHWQMPRAPDPYCARDLVIGPPHWVEYGWCW